VVLPALKPQMFCLESLKGQRNLLPRKIRDWIGTDPQLRENTQQIVKGWDVEGIDRIEVEWLPTFKGSQIVYSRLDMSCAMRLSRLRNC